MQSQLSGHQFHIPSHVMGATPDELGVGKLSCITLQPPMHVTGMPKVSQQLALRPVHAGDMGPLYSPEQCVGGLVDCWKPVKRIAGHLQVGPQVSAFIERHFDGNPALEHTLLDAIGSDVVDPIAMLSVVDGLRLEVAEFLSH